MAAHRCGSEFTREDLDKLTEALKDEEFRQLLLDYCKEVQDPENRKLYQSEFAQLEKERGFLVSFVNVTPGYVIKTSEGGSRKAFLNVCSSDQVDLPSYDSKNGEKGIKWTLPFMLAPPRNDFDKSNQRCIVYDVIFHPNTIKLAHKNEHFKKLLNKTALDGVQSNHNVQLDLNNIKFPKLSHKGVSIPTIIRKPDPDYDEKQKTNDPILDQLYPQINYNKPSVQINKNSNNNNSNYTTPNYTIKQRKLIEMKEYTYELDSKQHSAIPSHLIIEINLPLLSDTSDVHLDIKNKKLSLISEKQSKYKLDLDLPYKVNSDSGTAQFDLTKKILTINLPVIPDKIDLPWKLIKEDSGVESDSNSPCNSDEDNSIPGIEVISESETYRTSSNPKDDFLDSNLSYSIPPYVINVFDNMLILTLDVKNVDSDSLIMDKNSNNDGIRLKFASIGSGFFPTHYSLNLKLPINSKFSEPISEVWDNNVILQLEISQSDNMDHFYIGADDSMIKHNLETPITILKNESNNKIKQFLKNNIDYVIPKYTVNGLDNIIAFTFHVKNVDSNTFELNKSDGIKIKFMDTLQNHYALYLKFSALNFKEPNIDINTNNIVLTLENDDESNIDCYYIGLSDDNMKKEFVNNLEDDLSQMKIDNNLEHSVQVTAKGNNEMNISLHKKQNDEPRFDCKTQHIPKKDKENYDSVCSSNGSFKGILKYRNPLIGRSLSESNVDFMDYNLSPSYSISSADYIPEESSSLKKTVRFSNVITKQTFRTNSSILGQKTKNQRKKRNKKRAQERRSSEGDNNDVLEVGSNEDVFLDENGSYESKIISRKDERRDSGLMDTDDGDSDKCDSDKCNIKYKKEKHSSQILKEKNKGKYQEVNFKNDLIFDLDM